MELEALILLAEEAQKEAEERGTNTSGFTNRGKQYSEVHFIYTTICTVYTSHLKLYIFMHVHVHVFSTFLKYM